MRVLFLGGTGLTGPFAVRRLREAGHQVTVFHRGEHRAELPEGVRQVTGEFAHIPADLLRPEPDVVVHMWMLTEADAAAFLNAFRGSAGRAIVISSCDVYRAYGRLKGAEAGPPDPTPLDEDASLRESRYPYRGMNNLPIGCADEYDKVLVEAALRAQSELPVTILRYPAVYGPGDYHRFGPWLSRMEAGPELTLNEGFAHWRWTHGFAEDVAQAVVLAATNERTAGRTYNVGEAATPAWAERLAELGRVAGWNGRIRETTEPVGPALDYSHHLDIDTTRIRRELGYTEPVPREEGIRLTIAWERGQKAK